MSNNTTPTTNRTNCYRCYRPQSSCMCHTISPIETQTRFIILMHPKSFRQIKNGTGHFTHLSLNNSERHIGIDFSQDSKINAILENPSHQCYLLYPSTKSINLNQTSLKKEGKNTILFLIDATWPSAKTILARSPNIDNLPKVSFTHTKVSAFLFKRQPQKECLSTIESTHCVLELLNRHGDENLNTKALGNFLLPFEKMVAYQIESAKPKE